MHYGTLQGLLVSARSLKMSRSAGTSLMYCQLAAGMALCLITHCLGSLLVQSGSWGLTLVASPICQAVRTDHATHQAPQG